jgi:hypothetical protein
MKPTIRHKRTLFLGALATVVFVWAAITRFDVPAEEMAWLMVYCILGVLTTMVLAALTVAVFVGLKHLARATGLLRPPPE